VLLFFVIFGKGIVFSQQITEYELKAAYLFNFTKFVSWPAPTYIVWSNNDAAITNYIGIFGENPFGNILEQFTEQKNSRVRKWVIKYYKKIEDIDTCNILFISNFKTTEVMKLMKFIEGKTILTIGDNIDNFCQIGGIINFQPPTSSKPFEINNNAAIRANLKISPKLLNLAKIINTN
jgi:hypothetical protein